MGLFRQIDAESTGHLSMLETRNALYLLGIVVSDEQIQDLFEVLDLDGSALVDYTEFMELLSWAHARESQTATLPRAVIHFLQDKFGLQNLVDQATWDLLCNVECFRAESCHIRL